ncbi:MAG: hypothetical protein GC186_04170 [Rhodobacteraceae bacterium]|nr:hypothetical protein [Paracoccaceae bacterium]
MSDIGLTGLTLWALALVVGYPIFAALLAALRLVLARGASRALAGVALLAAALDLATPLFGLTLGAPGAWWADEMAGAVASYGQLAGMLPILVPLLLSGLLPGRRFRGIDLAHGLSLAGIVILYGLGI